MTVTDLSAGILNALFVGTATDDALLLIARYREEFHRTADDRHALLAATTPSIRGLGPVGALGVVGGRGCR